VSAAGKRLYSLTLQCEEFFKFLRTDEEEGEAEE